MNSRFQLPPKESLIAMGLTAGLAGLWMVQFENYQFIVLVSMIILFGFSIWARRDWGIFGLLMVAILLKFLNVSMRPRFEIQTLHFWDWLFPIAVLVFAGASFRFLEISKFIQAFYPTSVPDPEAIPKDGLSSPPAYRFPSIFGGRWWLIGVAVLLAGGVLKLIPWNPDSVQQFWILPRANRMILMISFLFLIWFLSRSLFLMISSWKMSAAQASVNLRSTIGAEFWSESSGIEKRRVKLAAKSDLQKTSNF